MIEIDENSAGQRIDNFLLRVCKGVPKSHIYRILRSGEVRVNKGRVDAQYRLAFGDIVRVPPVRVAAADLARAEATIVPPAHFDVLFEDDAMLVINKPAGVAVHGGSGVAFGVIEQMRQARPRAKFLELVHRLDRETSGILMLAKKRTALVGLHEQIRENKMDKRYFACVHGEWQPDWGRRRAVKAPLFKYSTPEGERRVGCRTTGCRRIRCSTSSICGPSTRFSRRNSKRVGPIRFVCTSRISGCRSPATPSTAISH